MANIKDKINNIRTALFGKDVRGSLADGLDAINQETETTTSRQEHLEDTFDQLIINSGTSNAEIVDARVDKNNNNSYAKLGDRLDAHSAQMEDIVQEKLPLKADTTQTENIQSQVNTLVINGTGNSNPEVVQGRVDSIGNINTTLKANMDSIDNIARKGITNAFVKNWTVGTLDATGIETVSTIRLRTGFQNFILGSKVLINVNANYKYKYYFYNKNKEYVGQTSWLTSNMDLLIEYPYYRFILSKNDDSIIDINIIDSILIKQDIETDILKKINSNTYDINKISGDIAPLGIFKLGNLKEDDTIITGNTNRVSLVKSRISKGDKIGFNKELTNKYKFAIDRSGDNVINFIQSKDGAYWLSPCVSLDTASYNFMIAKRDNTDFTNDEVIEVSNYFGVISLKSRVIDIENNEVYNPLYGKIITGLGDSFIDFNIQGLGNDLLSKIAYGNNMTIKNYGLSSSSLAYDSKQTVLSVMDRYQQMLTDVPTSDYIIVLAGHNDSNASLHGGTAIPIGTNSDTVNTTFKGALNILIKALLDKYPKAGILFLTPFNRRGTELPYVRAMEEMCEIYSVPCFNNYKNSGICFQNSTQLAIYDQANLHLNGLGNEKMAKKYIPIIKPL